MICLYKKQIHAHQRHYEKFWYTDPYESFNRPTLKELGNMAPYRITIQSIYRIIHDKLKEAENGQ